MDDLTYSPAHKTRPQGEEKRLSAPDTPTAAADAVEPSPNTIDNKGDAITPPADTDSEGVGEGVDAPSAGDTPATDSPTTGEGEVPNEGDGPSDPQPEEANSPERVDDTATENVGGGSEEATTVDKGKGEGGESVDDGGVGITPTETAEPADPPTSTTTATAGDNNASSHPTDTHVSEASDNPNTNVSSASKGKEAAGADEGDGVNTSTVTSADTGEGGPSAEDFAAMVARLKAGVEVKVCRGVWSTYVLYEVIARSQSYATEFLQPHGHCYAYTYARIHLH